MREPPICPSPRHAQNSLLSMFLCPIGLYAQLGCRVAHGAHCAGTNCADLTLTKTDGGTSCIPTFLKGVASATYKQEPHFILDAPPRGQSLHTS